MTIDVYNGFTLFFFFFFLFVFLQNFSLVQTHETGQCRVINDNHVGKSLLFN